MQRFSEGGPKMLTQHLSNKKLACLAAFSIVMFGTANAESLAAEETKYPSAEKGYQLAAKFCKSCHLIDGNSADTAPVGPPPFSWIANKAGQTTDRIKGSLIQPHPPMPDMHLSNDEIMNIIAYLDTLRSDDSVPPFLPPEGEAKPKYPSPT